MTALRLLNIPPGEAPKLNLFTRETFEAVGSQITGIAVVNFPTVYDFEIGTTPDGYYIGILSAPEGTVYVRQYLGLPYGGESWAILELIGQTGGGGGGGGTPPTPTPYDPLSQAKKYKTDDQEVEQHGLADRAAYERFAADKNGLTGFAAVRLGRVRLGGPID